jgi:L-amino acid dehydrogenase
MPYDVIIAGGGLSGLAAARLLAAEKKKVLLLEARNRIGGRMFRQQVYNEDTWIDRGGQWIQSDQENIMDYVKLLELKTFKQYAGKGIWAVFYENAVRFYRGAAPDAESEAAAIDLEEKLDGVAESHGVNERPWEAQDASALDHQTLAQWISENSKGNEGKDKFARYFVGWQSWTGQSGGSSWETPLLHSLFERSVNKDSENSEAYLLVGGAGQIAERLLEEAQKLGTELVSGSKVVAITQDGAGVTVTTTPYTSKGVAGTYEAKFAIVAMPPFLSGTIHYDPPLPARRLALVQRMPMGTIAKVACIYDNAWWRIEGRSGQALGDGNRTVQYVVDSGNPDKNTPGILTCFIQGNKYISWSTKEEGQRKQIVTDDLRDYFSDGAKPEPCVEYVEANWPAYPLTGGAYNAYAAVGAWTAYGPSLREPHDRVHWAGTEMATKWYGEFEGAISAGKTAAKQVLGKLG